MSVLNSRLLLNLLLQQDMAFCTWWLLTLICYLKVKCLNSLGVSDLMHQYILRTQKMSLYGKDMQHLSFVDSTMIISIIYLLPYSLFAAVYLPPSAITVHHLVAQVQRPNIEWPKSYQRSLYLTATWFEMLSLYHFLLLHLYEPSDPEQCGWKRWRL